MCCVEVVVTTRGVVVPEWLKDRAIASVQRVARNASLRRLGWSIFYAGQFSEGSAGNDADNDELLGAMLDGAADFMSMPSLKSSKGNPKPKSKPVVTKQNGFNYHESKQVRETKKRCQGRLRRRRGEKFRTKGMQR